MMEAN